MKELIEEGIKDIFITTPLLSTKPRKLKNTPFQWKESKVSTQLYHRSQKGPAQARGVYP